MRRGIWPAAATACALLGAWTASASAGGWHTIPRLTPAMDYRTGGQYYAPPIPYGHYVGKDIPGHVLGAVHGPFGLVRGKLGGLFHGHSHGHGRGGHECSDCGGADWDDSSGTIDSGAGYGGPAPMIQGQILGAPAGTIQSYPAGQITPMSGQVLGVPAAGPDRMIYDPALRGTGWGHAEASSQAGDAFHGGAYGSGMSIHGAGHSGFGHSGFGHSGFGHSGGGHSGGGHSGDDCGDAGAGGCGHGGACHQGGGHGGWGHGLLSLPHTALGAAYGVVGKVFHVGEIEYFVGPGGPVPLTPGYVPYIVPTRSPRNFLAFPPYSNVVP